MSATSRQTPWADRAGAASISGALGIGALGIGVLLAAATVRAQGKPEGEEPAPVSADPAPIDPAPISNEEAARALYEEGTTAYGEGRYEDAIAKFEAAFELSSRPLLLYNLSLAYERIGRYDKALENLRGYVASAPAEEQPIVRMRIQNLRARMEAAQAAGGSGDPGPAGDASELAPEAEWRGEPPPEPPPPPPVLPTEPGSGVNVPAVVALSAAGVFGVGAIVLGSLALAARDEALSLCVQRTDGTNLCRTDAREPMHRDENLSLASDISLGLGLGSAALGILLLVFEQWSAPETGVTAPAQSVTLAPAPGGMQVGVRARF